VHYLEDVQGKLLVRSPVPGLITTPRLKEKVGQYFKEGELICVLEDLEHLEVEIVVSEEEATCIQPGQAVELKARALPLRTFTSAVSRQAPVARGETAAEQPGRPPVPRRLDAPSTVTVCCGVEDPLQELRPGLTGYARIYRDKRSIGAILLDRSLRFLRTEFWWW